MATLSELFSGTFLSELESIATKGEFIDSPDPRKEGDEIIGEMTNLEKALATLLKRNVAQIRELVGKQCEVIGQAVKSGRNDPLLNKEQFCSLSLVKARQEALASLLWSVIRDRLTMADTSLGICRGFQIVKLAPQQKVGVEEVEDMAVRILTRLCL